MAEYSFGALRFDPATNPAILNTATWDEKPIIAKLSGLEKEVLGENYEHDMQALGQLSIHLHEPSYTKTTQGTWALCSSDDGQQFFLGVGRLGDELSFDPFYAKPLSNGLSLYAFKAEDQVIDAFVTHVQPEKGPRRFGPLPRLGLGNRHTTTLWPGIWRSMQTKGYAANAIQNSVRELHLLESLKRGDPVRENHLYSFGAMQEGHTGSTFEGLWTSGVLSALQTPGTLRFGADADHLQVKRGAEGIERTKLFIDAAKYYSFYTIDVSDILRYVALTNLSDGEIDQFLKEDVGTNVFINELVDFHIGAAQKLQLSDKPNREFIRRLLCKYWPALQAMERLDEYLLSIKAGREYDLELSIDETPADFPVFDAITRDAELLFLIKEIERRSLGVSHIAPNFGVEKGVDYRVPEGLEELSARVGRQVAMAKAHGLILDCHSGDDLSRQTRRVLGAASKGDIHFKLSPSLQVLYAQTLEDVNPTDFAIWWNDTLAYAQRSASQGSSIAIESLALLSEKDKRTPSASHLFFREYNFGTVGKRSPEGKYLYRSMFYSQSKEFQEQLTSRLEEMLNGCAEDLWE